MKNCTIFVDPINYRVNGFSYEIYTENPPKIPHFLSDENGGTTGIMYIDPIIVITGYDPELRYKTYNPETNTFI
jgi:hypothetical protein